MPLAFKLWATGIFALLLVLGTMAFWSLAWMEMNTGEQAGWIMFIPSEALIVLALGGATTVVWKS